MPNSSGSARFLKASGEVCWDSFSSEDGPTVYVNSKKFNSIKSSFEISSPQRKHRAGCQLKFQNLSQGSRLNKPKLSLVGRISNRSHSKNKVFTNKDSNNTTQTKLEIFLDSSKTSKNTQNSLSFSFQSPNFAVLSSKDETIVAPNDNIHLNSDAFKSGNLNLNIQSKDTPRITNLDTFERSGSQLGDDLICRNTKMLSKAASLNKYSSNNSNTQKHYEKVERTLEDVRKLQKSDKKVGKTSSSNKATTPQRKYNSDPQKCLLVSRIGVDKISDSDVQANFSTKNPLKLFKSEGSNFHEIRTKNYSNTNSDLGSKAKKSLNSKCDKLSKGNLVFSTKHCSKSIEESRIDSSVAASQTVGPVNRVDEKMVGNMLTRSVPSPLINFLSRTNPELQNQSKFDYVVNRSELKENKSKIEDYFKKVKKRDSESNTIFSRREKISNKKQKTFNGSPDWLMKTSSELSNTIVEQGQHYSDELISKKCLDYVERLKIIPKPIVVRAECDSTSNFSGLSTSSKSSYDSEQRNRSRNMISDYFSGWSKLNNVNGTNKLDTVLEKCFDLTHDTKTNLNKNKNNFIDKWPDDHNKSKIQTGPFEKRKSNSTFESGCELNKREFNKVETTLEKLSSTQSKTSRAENVFPISKSGTKKCCTEVICVKDVPSYKAPVVASKLRNSRDALCNDKPDYSTPNQFLMHKEQSQTNMNFKDPQTSIVNSIDSEHKKAYVENIPPKFANNLKTCASKISGTETDSTTKLNEPLSVSLVDSSSFNFPKGKEISYVSGRDNCSKSEIFKIAGADESNANQKADYFENDLELLSELQKFDNLNQLLTQSIREESLSIELIPKLAMSPTSPDIEATSATSFIKCSIENKKQKSYNITPSSLLYEENMLNHLVGERDQIRRGMRIKSKTESNEMVQSSCNKRYKKGDTNIFKLGIRYKKPEFKFSTPEQTWKKILDKIEGNLSDADSEEPELIPTPKSYVTDDSKSEILSTGSGVLPEPQTLLRSGINKLLKEKSLLFSENDDVVPFEFDKDEIRSKVCGILLEVVDGWIQEKKPKDLTWPTDDMVNCVFKENKYQMSQFPRYSIITYHAKHRRIKFNLTLFILNKIRKLLQNRTKITKRELFYQLKPMISDQRTTDRVIHEISRMLGVGAWALNIIAQKGLVFGNMKLVMSSGEVVNCNVPGSQIPSDVTDIIEIQSTAYFILVVEKDSIFNKLIEEGLPNKLTRPFIMITGKGFPDLNTQLFLKKLWMVMSIPVFILVDPDPHGVGIMMNYRFGSVANSHVSDHLAIPKSRWLGVFPSEIQELRLPSEILSEKDVKMVEKMLNLECVQQHPKIEEELRVMLKYKVKASIEGLIKCDTYLSNQYLNLKFYNNKYI